MEGILEAHPASLAHVSRRRRFERNLDTNWGAAGRGGTVRCPACRHGAGWTEEPPAFDMGWEGSTIVQGRGRRRRGIYCSIAGIGKQRRESESGGQWGRTLRTEKVAHSRFHQSLGWWDRTVWGDRDGGGGRSVARHLAPTPSLAVSRSKIAP